MRGLHLTADLYRCRCDGQWLADAQALAPWCREAAGLDAAASLLAAPDAQGGVGLALLLPGSHVCLHTWPAERSVALDVFLSDPAGDQAARARGLMDALVQRFQPEWTEQRSLDRGDGE